LRRPRALWFRVAKPDRHDRDGRTSVHPEPQRAQGAQWTRNPSLGKSPGQAAGGNIAPMSTNLPGQPLEFPSEFLTVAELRDLTQRARKTDQPQELEALGIPYLVHRGRVLVSRVQVRERLAGHANPKGQGINWAAIR
jgi:hypothetical protein